MLTERDKRDLLDTGISVDEKTGKFRNVSANKFAAYIHKRYQFIYSNEQFYGYNADTGIWYIIADLKMKTELRKHLHWYFDDIWSTRLEGEYMEALKRLSYFDGELNSYKEYINLKNGMFDIVEMKLVSHERDFYSTIQLPIEYDVNAKAPLFEKFLDTSFNNDEESKTLALQWIGYSMTAETKAQKALVLYGSGRNGKGVYLDILGKCVGRENTSNIAITELKNSFSRACLNNKTVNICGEVELSGGSFNTQYFKEITGEDEIMAEEKYKPAFFFKPTVKLVFSTNNLPYTKDTSFGFQRRLSILHFTNTIKEEDVDINLKENLSKELSGIFNLAMQELKVLRDNNYKFISCKVSESLLKEYSKDINPMISFFEECLEQADETYRQNKKDIYNLFKAWASENGLKGLADISTRRFWTRFNEQFKNLGYNGKAGHSNEFLYFTGVKIIESKAVKKLNKFSIFNK